MVTDRIDLSDVSLKMNCPKCGCENDFTLGQASRGEEIVCTKCGVGIKLVDNGSIDQAQSSVDRSMDELKKTIDSVNRKLGGR